MSAATISTDLRSAVGDQSGFAPTLSERPLRYLEPRADLDPALKGPIFDWPWRDKEIALELGRSGAFVEEMAHTHHNKRAWLASIVQGLRAGPAELGAQPPSLRGRTITLPEQPAFTFREF